MTHSPNGYYEKASFTKSTDIPVLEKVTDDLIKLRDACRLLLINYQQVYRFTRSKECDIPIFFLKERNPVKGSMAKEGRPAQGALVIKRSDIPQLKKKISDLETTKIIQHTTFGTYFNHTALQHYLGKSFNEFYPCTEMTDEDLHNCLWKFREDCLYDQPTNEYYSLDIINKYMIIDVCKNGICSLYYHRVFSYTQVIFADDEIYSRPRTLRIMEEYALTGNINLSHLK
jgi:hypothetical protein